MYRSRFFKGGMWVFLCTIFWAMTWSVAFFSLALLEERGINNLINHPSARSYLLLGSSGGAVGGAILGTVGIIYSTRSRKILGKAFVFYFWVVFWYVLVPIIWGLWWWVSQTNCTCGGELLCFCLRRDDFLSGPIITFFLLANYLPQYFIVSLIGSILLGWIFERLTARFLTQKMPPN